MQIIDMTYSYTQFWHDCHPGKHLNSHQRKIPQTIKCSVLVTAAKLLQQLQVRTKFVRIGLVSKKSAERACITLLL
jgi:hypothetical protein